MLHSKSEFVMGLFHFLIVVQGIIATSLVAIILMQRSEGGGLGMGGSPSGLMSARGAADFMTRTTTILATAFISLSIALAFVASSKGSTDKLDDSLKRVEAPETAPAAAPQTAPATEPAGAGDAAAPPSGTTPPPAPVKGEIPVG
jgi:preprotein translocase subunit SecG